MISVIISTTNAAYLKNVSENIEQTIGVPYELLTYQNANGEKGLCEIYNQGVNDAQYGVLCFMHDDIDIKTSNWGGTILSSFNDDPELGLIGISGCDYKSVTLSGWYCRYEGSEYCRLIQSYRDKTKPGAYQYYNTKNYQHLAPVATVDGAWFCTTKKIAQECRFDNITFKGFHSYDIDFSLSVSKKYKVAVTFDVLIEHFSEGNFDKTWYTEALKLHAKWNLQLPINTGNYSKSEMYKIERATFIFYLKRAMDVNCTLVELSKPLWLNGAFFKFSPKLFFKLQFYTIREYLRKMLKG
jgi:hypothetical protein